MLLEKPHRLRIDRFASDADRWRRAEEIKEALAAAPASAGLDQRGRLVPATVARNPEMRQDYFLFGFFFAAAGFALGRALGLAFGAGFFAAGRSVRTAGAGRGG